MRRLYIILFVLPLIGFGQGWETTFGGTQSDGGICVQQTIDGGFIISGVTESFGSGEEDLYLLKINENGEEIWSQTFGDVNDDGGISVQQTIDGGYIVTGFRESSVDGDEDVYLLKTDENGEEMWSQVFGYGNDDFDVGISVKQTIDEGYIIIGYTTSFGEEYDEDIYLLKTDENGEEMWFQIFGGTSYADQGWSVQQTIDQGYIICGLTGSFGNGQEDVYLLKTNENGEEEWSQTFGGTEEDQGRSIQQTLDGGYIICGVTESFGNGEFDVYLLKTDENGEEMWSQTFGDVNDDGGFCVQQTIDGGYIISGVTTFDNGTEDVYLLKTDENGEEEWSQTFGGVDNDWGWSVQQTTDGGYVICGHTFSFGNGNSNVYLIKTDEQGNVTSTIELPTPTSKRELVKTTNILGQENTTIKNQPLIEIYDDGSTEKKIVLE